jgi:hypothetical protein
VNVEAVARVLVEEAMEPLRHTLRDAEARVGDLERRLAAALAAPPHAGHVPAISPAAASAPAASFVPAQMRSVPPAPVLIRQALAQDVPINADDIRAFDGGRRRRRMIILLAIFLVIVFGGLFAMLAESYTRHNT